MKLEPSRPPGRATRKAGAFAADIQRLRVDGYTFAAIREALAAAGVEVSLKTVQREAARPQPSCTRQIGKPPPCAEDERRSTVAHRSPTEGPTPNAQRITGRDIAEAFMQTHPSHPLLKP